MVGLTCPVCGLQLDGEQVEVLKLDDMPDAADVAAGVAERDGTSMSMNDIESWRGVLFIPGGRP